MTDINAALGLLRQAGTKAVQTTSKRSRSKSPRKRNLLSVCQIFKTCGWATQIVEHFTPRSKTTTNLFGCINVVAVKASSKGALGLLALQGSRIAHAFERIEQSPEIKIWLAANNRFVIILIDDLGRNEMFEVTKETLATKGVIKFNPH